MRRSAFVLFFLSLTAISLRAQVIESATVRPFTISAGGSVSVFNPNLTGLSQTPYGVNAPANYLIGLGTYADFHFTHWIQIEGEARWLRLNQQNGEFEDQYLIGPKIPLLEIGRASVFGKAMIGIGKLRFSGGHAYCTALAFGGGIDYRLSRKLTLRAIDFEFQEWPRFLDKASSRPYGATAGISYRVF